MNSWLKSAFDGAAKGLAKGRLGEAGVSRVMRPRDDCSEDMFFFTRSVTYSDENACAVDKLELRPLIGLVVWMISRAETTCFGFGFRC